MTGPYTPPQPDPHVVWAGYPENLAAIASGAPPAAVYHLTHDALHFAPGLIAPVAEPIPLVAVYDVMLRESFLQRARGLADLVVQLDRGANRLGLGAVTMLSIREPVRVRDTILGLAHQARGGAPAPVPQWPQQPAYEPAPPPPPAPQPAAEDDLLTKLERLAALRSSGALTEEEFTAAKAKLLG